MFSVNGNPLMADEMEILQELKNQLKANGIMRFATFKRSTRNIQFNCPIHGDGQERKPSCGISTKQNGNIPAGTVHCFTCGYTADLEAMVSHCFGKDDYGAFGREWLVKNFLTVAVEFRKDVVLDFERKVTPATPDFVPEETLNGYRFYHDYMYKRKLTDEVISMFDVGYDDGFILSRKGGQKKIQCITFPVRDIAGRTLFIARRSVNTKFFHYPPEVKKPVYGLFELPHNADTVIICESIINALTCYVYGKPAVALLGLGTEYQMEQLRKLPTRKFIIALDGDAAGQAATQRIKKALSGRKLVTQYIVPNGKDINDLSFEEFSGLVEIF